MAAILIVEDHDGLRIALCCECVRRGHDPLPAASGEDAIRVGLRSVPAAVVFELSLPELGGVGAFAALRSQQPALVGVGISGAVDADAGARMCHEAGASGFFPKPFDTTGLIDFVERSMAGSKSLAMTGRQTFVPARPPGIVGSSPAMCEVFRRIARVARTEATVLIEGETGTGKEHVARSIHDTSERREGPFVAVNCAALPRELAEAELFGSERGAFTEAVSRPGLFEQAQGGTLFLDEIGDLALGAQGILLRVLDQRVVRRLGSLRDISIDARIVAATNIDLQAAVQAGRFRSDLWYRVNQVHLAVPPLRSRGDDLLLLVQLFLPRTCRKLGVSPKRLADGAWAALQAYAWPGNVRELEQTLTHACCQTDADTIEVVDLPPGLQGLPSGSYFAVPPRPAGLSLLDASHQLRAVAERRWIEDAIAGSGTWTGAARQLGIDRKTLYEKATVLGVRPRGPRP